MYGCVICVFFSLYFDQYSVQHETQWRKMLILFYLNGNNVQRMETNSYLVILMLPDKPETILFCVLFDMVEYSMRLALFLTYLILATFWMFFFLVYDEDEASIFIPNIIIVVVFLLHSMDNSKFTWYLFHALIGVEIFRSFDFSLQIFVDMDSSLKIENQTTIYVNAIVKRERGRENNIQRNIFTLSRSNVFTTAMHISSHQLLLCGMILK